MQGAERVTVSTLFALLLGYGLMQMGNTFQGTLLSIRGGIEGFSPVKLARSVQVFGSVSSSDRSAAGDGSRRLVTSGHSWP
jgi:hypothetical protein